MRDPLADLHAYATNDDNCDPALDADDVARLKLYRETRELADAPVKPGATPVRFVLRPIPPIVRAMSLAKMDPDARHACAFLASCHEILLPDGRELRPRKVERGAHGALIADDAWINDVAAEFGLETVLEMGRLAYQRASLRRDARGPFWYPRG